MFKGFLNVSMLVRLVQDGGSKFCEHLDEDPLSAGQRMGLRAQADKGAEEPGLDNQREGTETVAAIAARFDHGRPEFGHRTYTIQIEAARFNITAAER